ncbi:hypothetical protein [Microvirga yunnanensis]|nr:hypothetical protein [Microvirga sp. HBU65207]
MSDQHYDEQTRRTLDDAADQIENGPGNEDTLVVISDSVPAAYRLL